MEVFDLFAIAAAPNEAGALRDGREVFAAELERDDSGVWKPRKALSAVVTQEELDGVLDVLSKNPPELGNQVPDHDYDDEEKTLMLSADLYKEFGKVFYIKMHEGP